MKERREGIEETDKKMERQLNEGRTDRREEEGREGWTKGGRDRGREEEREGDGRKRMDC